MNFFLNKAEVYLDYKEMRGTRQGPRFDERFEITYFKLYFLHLQKWRRFCGVSFNAMIIDSICTQGIIIFISSSSRTKCGILFLHSTKNVSN